MVQNFLALNNIISLLNLGSVMLQLFYLRDLYLMFKNCCWIILGGKRNLQNKMAVIFTNSATMMNKFADSHPKMEEEGHSLVFGSIAISSLFSI